MSKVIISPVKKWPGSITLADPLTYPQLFVWRDANDAALEFTKPSEESGRVTIVDGAHYAQALIPGVLACIERWDLAGFPDPVTVESFPSSPVRASVRLLAALNDAIGAMISEDEEIPNA